MSLRPNERAEDYCDHYIVVVDAEQGRRQREDNMVEIHKSKREESLLKKRREVMQAPISTQVLSIGKKAQLESLPVMAAGVCLGDRSLQLEATTQFWKLLSIERSPLIEEVIQAGVMPHLFEAAWALTNIASGTSENLKIVIDHGVISIFVKLLASNNDDVHEQVFRARPIRRWLEKQVISQLSRMLIREEDAK